MEAVSHGLSHDLRGGHRPASHRHVAFLNKLNARLPRDQQPHGRYLLREQQPLSQTPDRKVLTAAVSVTVQLEQPGPTSRRVGCYSARTRSEPYTAARRSLKYILLRVRNPTGESNHREAHLIYRKAEKTV